jgi:hypothetical protein
MTYKYNVSTPGSTRFPFHEAHNFLSRKYKMKDKSFCEREEEMYLMN